MGLAIFSGCRELTDPVQGIIPDKTPILPRGSNPYRLSFASPVIYPDAVLLGCKNTCLQDAQVIWIWVVEFGIRSF